ncbi:ubiquitin carboxyl-terminal hydrolase [Lineolata rhizophorae]|uniref:Ubiquitin carboxyl-terminal hydrolase n=1 Tax=Lineolata rhizophorae TaxID=578093 RepID=A0A6A6P7D6_9PEZI|nr:ubiquitin carboxyl-terminal hydrolase [Lineolata rhizophorae]
MAQASKRRRVGENNEPNSTANDVVFSKDLLSPITAEERRKWQGFCEIDSDPAIFNVMLKEFGVHGVRVQEVLGLDPELLDMLPKPVYGLIFLFRYREDGSENQEASCPDHVWFANQLTGNACATVALLNLVNNISEAELGECLRSFRDFTKEFTPAQRGYQLVNFEFIKNIHNSFARKMDMMNIDLGMKNNYTDRKRSRKDDNADEDENDQAFHFIAFVPINGEVWQLDGLDRQPRNLGAYLEGNWLGSVAPLLVDKMAAYEQEEIEFNLMSLVKDPVTTLREELAANICSLRKVEKTLDDTDAEWKNFTTDSDDDVVRGPDLALGVFASLIEDSNIPAAVEKKVAIDESMSGLLDVRHDLINQQAKVKIAIRDEAESARADTRKALERRCDFGPMIHKWVGYLAENGVLRELVETVG